jgi:uroporphyrinogen-III decarboxylase
VGACAQGNMDAGVLFGTKDTIEQRIIETVRQAEGKGVRHIMNLGHGVMQVHGEGHGVMQVHVEVERVRDLGRSVIILFWVLLLFSTRQA